MGKNLVASLKNIRDGKDRTHPGLHIREIFEYDVDTDPALLEHVKNPEKIDPEKTEEMFFILRVTVL